MKKTKVSRVADNTRAFLEYRGSVDEYVAAISDTTEPLHNRDGCTPATPCALCRRRWKAEARLLGLVGRNPRSSLAFEIARALATEASKRKRCRENCSGCALVCLREAWNL